MDKLRIQLVNKELNQKTAIEFLRKLSKVTMKSKDFLILEKDEEGFSYFASNEKTFTKNVLFPLIFCFVLFFF
jgi:hypothetical protein